MDTSGMVPIGHPMSVLSILGIPWLIICVVAGCSGWRGWLSCLCLFFMFMAFVGAFRVNPVPTQSSDKDEVAAMAPYVEVDGKFINEREWIRQDEMAYEKRTIHNPYEVHMHKPRYYRMHAYNGLEAWFYHPDAWWWGPGIGCIVGLILHPTWLAGLYLGTSIFFRK